MFNITQDNVKDFAFEDEGDDDYFSIIPENEAEKLIEYYEQKYGFKKIAG